MTRVVITGIGVVSCYTCVEYPRDQPPRLSSSCFQDDLDLSVAFEVGSRPATIELRLPVRQYSRVAYLSDSASTVLRRKAGSCRLPGGENALEILNLKYQADYIDYVGGRFQFTFPHYVNHRGIPGWYNLGCVWWGDSVGPTTGDWWSQMTALTGDLRPIPVSRLDF